MENSATLLYGGNASFVEGLYEDYLHDPQAVPSEWRLYFDGLRDRMAAETPHSPIQRAFYELAQGGARMRVPAAPGAGGPARANELLAAVRELGHFEARFNPLYAPSTPVEELKPEFYGLSAADMAATVSFGSFNGSLGDALKALKDVYCGPIGYELHHLSRPEREWFQSRIENTRPARAAADRKRLYEKLSAAEGLEKYLHTRFVGQKRFSLEGGESMIPMLDASIRAAAKDGAKEVVLGMAHRGRLNVLVNVMGKKSAVLFNEFEGKFGADGPAMGDVKYHLGYDSAMSTESGDVLLHLLPNPSHLELVDPVVEGAVRAIEDWRRDEARRTVMPILIHGDAAVSGQGIVFETLNFSQLRGFFTGGTLHLVINNQVGFTVAHPEDTRSTRYCTDVAKYVEAPVLHVNGDDPEACAFAMELAVAYRTAFQKDIFIDLVCYRRHGHNEADEPRATNPVLYQAIDKHTGTRALYAKALEEAGVLAAGEAQAISDAYRDALDAGKRVADVKDLGPDTDGASNWSNYLGAPWTLPAETGAPIESLKRLAEKVSTLPEGFKLHPRVASLIKARAEMAAGKAPLDWGMAETLAYATLLTSGFPVRLSGQDAGRGTFFHRHAALHDQTADEVYKPLQHLDPTQARFEVIESTLSEEAVLAFEYGYASTNLDALVLWEAQYGDFANGAQAILDQYVSSAETKWNRLSGLVILLPHGFEGQGPEHSSARLERYLQLCAEDNWQVCVPSTPAQVFHMLRRQLLRAVRKPLVVFNPKSLLRHKAAVSSLDELATGRFKPVIGEEAELPRVERVVLCSGKLYYELLEARHKHEVTNVALVRIEQLYPFPTEHLREELARYGGVPVIWAQEEPQNQGAWHFIRDYLQECLAPGQELRLSSRPASASPATGYPSKHVAQQSELIDRALGLAPALEPVLRNDQFTG